MPSALVFERDKVEPLRHGVSSALGYRFLGVTRAEIEQQTARAKQAAESMGELPPKVISGELRASLLPNRVVPESETVVAPRHDGPVTIE